MLLSEFTRIYPMRAQGIMWFFGAGASATAGIATAWDMLWEFKRSIYCSQTKVSLKSCGDLTDERVQHRIQTYVETHIKNCPKPGDEDEYAFFFEQAYASDMDRRTYIDSKIKSGTPSFGHECLGILINTGLVRLMWTTNFDRLIEDVAVKALGSTSKLVVASIDNAQVGIQAVNESRWPIYIKIHGDFQSRKLKNIQSELLTQDSQMRESLIDCSRRFGLAVVGYSGRDDSVMEALEKGLVKGAYPNGLFWFRRSPKGTYSRVTALIEKAKELGIEADFVEAESFDELFHDIVTQIPTIPEDALQKLKSQKPRLTEAPMPAVGTGRAFPILRLNALPVLEYPCVMRLINCDIGGTREVNEALAAAGSNAIAVRSKDGILAFGSDAELKKAFNKYRIKDFDIKQVDTERLNFQSAELGLIYDALIAALLRSRPLCSDSHRGNRLLYVDKQRQTDPIFLPLKKTVGNLTGIKDGFAWAEGIRLKLDYKFGQLWLLFEPATWIADASLKDFVRARMSSRFNGAWNGLLGAWSGILSSSKEAEKLRALGIGDGLDAVFTVSGTTAFSRITK